MIIHQGESVGQRRVSPDIYQRRCRVHHEAQVSEPYPVARPFTCTS
jgi:hypothetical protein